MSGTQQKNNRFDVLVIGGGINGAGIARDCAGRGLSVLLVERDDLASATSAASTKLIHGGLRYLEHYEFRLVREALKEREVLLRSAPHIIWPLTFVLPHHSGLRPRWLIRLGLFLYDHIGGRKILPKSRAVGLAGTVTGNALKDDYASGFTYADCWVEDTRLVILNALDAKEKGAHIMPRAECMEVERVEGGWRATLRDGVTGRAATVEAAVVVNAAGPWVGDVARMTGGASHHVRHVKGSHIIVPRLYTGEHAYILQNDDDRVVFVIPYEGRYSLIGTTDVEYTGDLDDINIGMDEVEYLCTAVNRYFRRTVTPHDVRWTYSGVRPLLDDGARTATEVTRDYHLEISDEGAAPLLTVYGGKLTTYRRLAENAGDRIVAALGRGRGPWTGAASLPGGEGVAFFETFYKTFRREFGWLPEAVARRLARAYGTRARDFLRGYRGIDEMGEHFGDGVYEAEIRYLVSAEWAMTPDDIFWRRSKLGLHVAESTIDNVEDFLRRLLHE